MHSRNTTLKGRGGRRGDGWMIKKSAIIASVQLFLSKIVVFLTWLIVLMVIESKFDKTHKCFKLI